MTTSRSFIIRLALWITAGVVGFNVAAPAWAGDESGALTPIFTGKDLAGWKTPDPNPFWKAVDGVLVGENDPAKKGSMLWTEKSYRDFVIEWEARWKGEIDSGIMFRQSNERPRELQLQIGISRSLKRDLTGSFYTGGKEKYPEAGQVKNLEKLLKPAAWNQFRLEARGDTFTVWLNGEPAVKYVNTNYAGAGPIGLQIHPGLEMKIEFRNLRVKGLE
ncbi:MAG: DUF1080 domain-containing protein [Verrucomicrobia bacterium]|nr:DUF1080 domain-containing protein [Verrucomicrobiota bacterium]